MSWQERELRKALENVVTRIQMAINPNSPLPLTRDEIVDVLVPNLLASTEGYLDQTQHRDSQIIANLKARVPSTSSAFDQAVADVIQGIRAGL